MQILELYSAAIASAAFASTGAGALLLRRAPLASEQAASLGLALGFALAYLALLGSDVALAVVLGLPIASLVWVHTQRAAIAHLRRVASWGCSAAARGDYARARRQLKRMHLESLVPVGDA